MSKSGGFRFWVAKCPLLKRCQSQIVLGLEKFPCCGSPNAHVVVLVNVLLRPILFGILWLFQRKDDLLTPRRSIVISHHVDQLHPEEHCNVILNPIALLLRQSSQPIRLLFTSHWFGPSIISIATGRDRPAWWATKNSVNRSCHSQLQQEHHEMVIEHIASWVQDLVYTNHHSVGIIQHLPGLLIRATEEMKYYSF